MFVLEVCEKKVWVKNLYMYDLKVIIFKWDRKIGKEKYQKV